MYNSTEHLLYKGFLEKADGSNLYLPLEIDTEYTHPATIEQPRLPICTTITVQCKAIWQRDGIIYGHPDIATKSRHKVFKYDFVGWDYLEDLGHEIEPIEDDLGIDGIIPPSIQVDVYSFFALAELFRMFQGQYYRDLKNIVVHGVKHRGVISLQRRLITYHQVGTRYFDWIYTPWLLLIDGHLYSVKLSIKDTSAIQGKTNYKTFCENSNIKLKYKDNFLPEEKLKMYDMYINRPDDFDNYALGDLYNYDALLGNAKNFESIYESLGLADYYTPPKYTIGSTVSKILSSGINKLFNHTQNDNKIINKYCKYGSADYLKRLGTTGCLNAKVDGGRCRNNRPTDTFVRGLLCDIDIAGCYGEGLRVQEYPLGIPCVLDYPRDNELNKYLTLKQFLDTYGDDLVPGLWQARVSLKEGYKLKLKQDYLLSWIPPRDLNELVTDTELQETDQWWEIDNVGVIKIFHNDIQNAIITHDFLQWLDNVATKPQRSELLSKLVVHTAMWYPKQLRVNSIKELERQHKNFFGSNTTTFTAHTRKTKTSKVQQCHYWYGINLGDLLVNQLLIERKKHKKKTPLNNLYKLCINTVYGDMVSPYFKVGNVVVGNNITARARSLAWCMEKGLNGFQTITDGCVFELNNIPYAQNNRKISGVNSVKMYLNRPGDKISYKPLIDEFSGDVTVDDVFLKTYDFVDGEYSLKDEYNKMISNAAMKHLQDCFPGLDILHQPTTDVYGNQRKGQFNFEVKGLFEAGCFHGSANYALYRKDDIKTAMRSYSKKPKSIPLSDDEKLIIDGKRRPFFNFLNSLIEPTSIPRSEVFLDERILKIGDYKKNINRWLDSRVLPGDTIYTARLLREFSLSQFTFKSYQQYKYWTQEYQRVRRKNGQAYEMFYIYKNGRLNYEQMILDVNSSILSGEMSFVTKTRFPNYNAHRNYQPHEQLDLLEKVKGKIDDMYRK